MVVYLMDSTALSAADAAVAVAAVQPVPVDAVAIPCPTFRKRARSNCRRCGEDAYYRLGMGERRAVDRP
jgi:ArsR family metal-binding transcriptional regulator